MVLGSKVGGNTTEANVLNATEQLHTMQMVTWLPVIAYYANSVLYSIPSKYISHLQRTQNTLGRVLAGSCTPNRPSNLATLSKLHWLLVHDLIKFKIATMTNKAIYTGNPPYLANLVQWHTPCRTLRLPLPTFSLSLVVTSHWCSRFSLGSSCCLE